MNTEPLTPSSWTPPTPTATPAPRRRLVRPRRGRWIGGVCAGLGARFGLSPNLVRLIFVVSCLLPGPQFIVYLMLWLIIPVDEP